MIQAGIPQQIPAGVQNEIPSGFPPDSPPCISPQINPIFSSKNSSNNFSTGSLRNVFKSIIPIQISQKFFLGIYTNVYPCVSPGIPNSLFFRKSSTDFSRDMFFFKSSKLVKIFLLKFCNKFLHFFLETQPRGFQEVCPGFSPRSF